MHLVYDNDYDETMTYDYDYDSDSDILNLALNAEFAQFTAV